MTDLIFKPEQDEAPDTDQSAVEYPCVVCGRESGPYGGRGRKPTKCPEHKGNGTPSVKRGTTPIKNAVLAGQAADALVQLNSIVALVATLAQYEGTGDALRIAQDGFREQAYQALLTDPELCRSILKGGVMSGRVALLIAYAMLGSVVAPVAMYEAREKSRERKAARDALDAE
jgi:hypothetical protein